MCIHISRVVVAVCNKTGCDARTSVVFEGEPMATLVVPVASENGPSEIGESKVNYRYARPDRRAI